MASTDSSTLFTDFEDEVMLPEGYSEGDDFFDIDSWGQSLNSEGASDEEEEAPESETESEEEESENEEESEVSTTDEEDESEEDSEAEESEGAEEEEAPTTEQPRTLHFKAKVDHSDVDVDITEDELPTLYQKANNHDRMQAKLDKMNESQSRYAVLAKTLGYENVDAMLDAAEKNWRDSEITRLTDEGVHEEVAADIVDRKFNKAKSEIEKATPQPQSQPQTPERDFQAEAQELLTARPGLQHKTLPQEVFSAAAKGKTLLEAYTEYEARIAKAENAKLQKENKIMRQNAKASSKAPVSGTKRGGKTDTEPEDAFLKGFFEDDY